MISQPASPVRPRLYVDSVFRMGNGEVPRYSFART